MKDQGLPLSDGRTNTEPPDSYMVLKDKESSIPEAIRQKDKDSWADIPVLLEFKNDATYYDVRFIFQPSPLSLIKPLPRI